MWSIRSIDFSADVPDLAAFLDARDCSRLPLYQPAIADGDMFIQVAVCEQQVVGWAVVHLTPREDMGWEASGGTVGFQQGRNAYLENIEVSPSWRNRGIGAALLKAAENQAATSGKDNLWLHTSKENVGAQRFYVRHGWVHERTVYPTWKQGAATFVYRRRLTQD